MISLGFLGFVKVEEGVFVQEGRDDNKAITWEASEDGGNSPVTSQGIPVSCTTSSKPPPRRRWIR